MGQISLYPRHKHYRWLMTAESQGVSLSQGLTLPLPDCLPNMKWVALKRYTDEQFYMDSGG